MSLSNAQKRKVLIAALFIVLNVFIGYFLYFSDFSLTWRIGFALLSYAVFFACLLGYFRFVDAGPNSR